MSNNQSSSFTSYSSTSYSSYSSSSTGDGQPQGHSQSYTERANYDSRHGGTTERISTETGKPTLVERSDIPVGGGRAVSSGTNSGQGRIQDVTDEDSAQAAKDREYLERMEDEYAKREGGA